MNAILAKKIMKDYFAKHGTHEIEKMIKAYEYLVENDDDNFDFQETMNDMNAEFDEWVNTVNDFLTNTINL